MLKNLGDGGFLLSVKQYSKLLFQPFGVQFVRRRRFQSHGTARSFEFGAELSYRKVWPHAERNGDNAYESPVQLLEYMGDSN